MAQGKPISTLLRSIVNPETSQYVMSLASGGAGSNRKILGQDISGAYLNASGSINPDLAGYGDDLNIVCDETGDMAITASNELQNGKRITIFNAKSSGNVTLAGTLPAKVLAIGESIILIQYDDTLWFDITIQQDLSNVVLKDGTNAPFNASIGVTLQQAHWKTDFKSTDINFQVGEFGAMSGGGGSSVISGISLMHNAYQQEGDPDGTYTRMNSGDARWSSRLYSEFGSVFNRMGFQYAAAGLLDFNFLWAWGINLAGDIAIGNNPNENLPSGDQYWTYQWYEKNRVRAISKSIAPNTYLFEGVNIYPTGTGALSLITPAAGVWSFSIESVESGKHWYTGETIGGESFTLASLIGNLVMGFEGGGDRISLNRPVALGAIMDAEFLTTDENIVQHQLGALSPLQSSIAAFLYDVWGSGFRSELILGSEIEESFNALPDTIDLGKCLVATRDGYIVGIGSSGLQDEGHAVVKDPSGGVTQNDITVDADFPSTAVANAFGDRLFYIDSSTLTGGYQILRSINNGVTWSVVHTEASVFSSGSVVLRDETIVMSQYGNIVGLNPLPRYSVDNGDTWLAGTANAAAQLGSSGVTVGFNHVIYMEHSDGTIYYAAIGTAANDHAQLWKSTTGISGAWILVGDINIDQAEKVNCSFIDSTTDDIYVGMYEAEGTENVLIRRSSNGGASWTTVYSEPRTTAQYVMKIIKTPENTLYAIIRLTAGGSRVIRSLDGGSAWTSISTSASLIRDIIYVPADASVYLIHDNSAGGKGFIVETIAVEEEYATLDNSFPVKQRMYNGQLDTFISDSVVDDGDKINFGLPVMSIAKKFFGILRNVGAAIVRGSAPIGSLFRNSEDSGYLWVKELDGFTYPLNGLEPQFLTAGVWTAHESNTQPFLEKIEFGVASTLTYYDVLSMTMAGSPDADYFYFTVAPPRGWKSGKVKFSVSYILPGVIGTTDPIGFELAVARRDSGSPAASTWLTLTHIFNVSPVSTDEYHTSPMSAELDAVSATDEEDLSLRIKIDETVPGMLVGDMKFVGLKLVFV
ncbi:MAG: exo-alpha-sialidase [Deltaproteobacteria bacterium]|nr:exo-alpha-sialidase [Deltaproteobacteria bacterium]